LAQAERRKVPCFSFNTVVPEAVRRRRGLDLTNVLGQTNDTLPCFAALLCGGGGGGGGGGATDSVHSKLED
jgi:hypothetical protein